MNLKCAMGLHDWGGCKCNKCGKTRDEGHEWVSIGPNPVDKQYCRSECQRCHAHKDEEHAWIEWRCKRCRVAIDDLLVDTQSQARRRAMTALFQADDSEAVRLLNQRVASADTQSCIEILDNLFSVGNQARPATAISVASRALRRSEAKARVAAVRVLASHGGQKDVDQELARVWKDPDPAVRLSILDALFDQRAADAFMVARASRNASGVKPLLDLLKWCLDDVDEAVRHRAIDILGRECLPETVPLLLRLTLTAPSADQGAVQQALGKFKEREALAGLCLCLQDTDPRVREMLPKLIEQHASRISGTQILMNDHMGGLDSLILAVSSLRFIANSSSAATKDVAEAACRRLWERVTGGDVLDRLMNPWQRKGLEGIDGSACWEVVDKAADENVCKWQKESTERGTGRDQQAEFPSASPATIGHVQLVGSVVSDPSLGFEVLTMRLIASPDQIARVRELGIEETVVARGMANGKMLETRLELLLRDNCSAKDMWFTVREDAANYVQLLSAGIDTINKKLKVDD